MPQADETAGDRSPPPKPRAREPWLAFGLPAAAAVLAGLWLCWTDLQPPASTEKKDERKAYLEKRVPLDVLVGDDAAGLTYTWVQTAGPSVEIHDADKPHAYFMACEAARYVFEIHVSDGKDTSMAQVVRTVKDADLAGRSPGKD